MSDIPLRPIRRNRPQYSRINDDEDPPPISLTSPAMRSSVAAVASTSRNNHKRPKGKERERYVDDPRDSEGARLLAGHYDQGEEGEEAAEEEEEPQQIPVTPHKEVRKDKSRTIPFNPPEKLQSRYPPNIVRNQKYNAFTFLPIVFYEQFKFFFNLYFLLVALSQFIPALKIGAFVVYF
jgi:phospholipid-translocating ATPase